MACVPAVCDLLGIVAIVGVAGGLGYRLASLASLSLYLGYRLGSLASRLDSFGYRLDFAYRLDALRVAEGVDGFRAVRRIGADVGEHQDPSVA